MRAIFGSALLGMVAMASLSACADGRGYGGVNLGVGIASAGYDPYYDAAYGSGYSGAYGYGGWYNGLYYPGSGYYVYDRAGNRSRWDADHRRHWEGRREALRGANPAQREAWRQDNRQAMRDYRAATGASGSAEDVVTDVGVRQPRAGFRGNGGMRVEPGGRAGRSAERIERREGRAAMAVGRERAPRTRPQ